MNNYTAEDLQTLAAGKAFRTKIGMYLSADRQEAINLGLRELIVNVQDEYSVYKPKNPYCRITLDSKTRIITVEDNMRGIPCAVRNDGINSLTAAFLLPHSGAKHKEGAYVSSVGINGEGNKIVCHTAEWLKVEVHRDGKIYTQEFISTDEGATATAAVKETKGDASTGTKITYKPDVRVYGDVFIDIPKLEKMLEEMSYFTKGLDIILINDGKEKHFYSKNGLVDGLSSTNRIGKPFNYTYSSNDCEVELALQWVSKLGQIKGYANGLYMSDGGAFITAFKTALTRTFNTLANEKFDGNVIRQYLDGFVSVKVHEGQFSNQAKTALANKEAATATNTAITEALKKYYKDNREDFEKVITLLKKIEKAEAAAERARQQVLSTEKELKDSKKKAILLADKLKDCKLHNEQSILMITEGDSALNSLALGRAGEALNYHALFPIRGKIISALKNPTEDVLNNEEVKAIFGALNCGFFEKYNSKKLRYGKIGITADQDKDGDNIFVLLTTLFYFMAPDLLKEGRIYRIESPLYVLYYNNDKRYATSATERDEIIKKHGKPNRVGRIKGLGELNPDDVENAIFGNQKHWDKLIVKNWNEFSDGIQLMMSKNVEPRKEYIMNNVDFSRVEE